VTPGFGEPKRLAGVADVPVDILPSKSELDAWSYLKQGVRVRVEQSKVGAQKKTEAALQALRSNQQDCEAKLADIHRRMDDTQNEVKALLQKGQKEKAKLVLRRKKMLEKQAMAVQNVSPKHPSTCCSCQQVTLMASSALCSGMLCIGIPQCSRGGWLHITMCSQSFTQLPRH
jgi:hypothetical protein